MNCRSDKPVRASAVSARLLGKRSANDRSSAANPARRRSITAAGVPWRWVRVDPSLDAASWPEFNPVSDSGVDPLVPLLRRWRYHDSLATLVEKRSCGLSDEQRAVLLAEESAFVARVMDRIDLAVARAGRRWRRGLRAEG